MITIRCGDSAYGVPLMKFALFYEGVLPAQTQSSTKAEHKQRIRRDLDPQLRQLWATNPALKRALMRRVVPKGRDLATTDTHHSQTEVLATLTDANGNPLIGSNSLDLCASIDRGIYSFRPLVRNSYALVCSLSILFLRNGPEGKVYQGGDLDNRIKVLLDALTVPKEGQRCIDQDDGGNKHIYCLLEDDSLITGLEVKTRQLLDRPNEPENHVKLVIDVTVNVTDARTYNILFLGD